MNTNWHGLLTENIHLFQLFDMNYTVADIDQLWTFVSGRIRDVVYRNISPKWNGLLQLYMSKWDMSKWIMFKAAVKRPIGDMIQMGSDTEKPLNISSEAHFNTVYGIPNVINMFTSMPSAIPNVVSVPNVVVNVPTFEDLKQKQAEASSAFDTALKEVKDTFIQRDPQVIRKALNKANAAWERLYKAHGDVMAALRF